jgi:hypothetical protein
MPTARHAALTAAAIALLAGFFSLVLATGEARAEIFYCQSTRSPSGTSKYCNFLLFDRTFTRHRQIVVAQGARREVALNGRYDVFCVLVQNTRGVPENIGYRKEQCRKTDTGREYKVPIRALNMRRGRDGFSTDAVSSHLPKGW